MCGCMQVYAYLIGCINQRTLLDQHSHCFHVPKPTRRHQRCRTDLPSQPRPASVRVRRGGGDASEGACVGSMHACPSIMCENKYNHVSVFMRSTRLD
jgi:hypothetical protein